MADEETPRRALRRMLAEPEVLVLPGAYDALSATLVQRSGFRGAYMTGAGVSMALIGFPDLGFTTMTEMAGQAARIAAVIDIPLVADADTGFGNALSVQRTVAEYQRAGVAGLHIKDQEFPKRCGTAMAAMMRALAKAGAPTPMTPDLVSPGRPLQRGGARRLAGRRRALHELKHSESSRFEAVPRWE